MKGKQWENVISHLSFISLDLIFLTPKFMIKLSLTEGKRVLNPLYVPAYVVASF